MACRQNPSACSALAQRARNQGCRFLWLLSFGQAKESDPLAGMRAEHAGTRSGYREPLRRQSKDKIKMDPGFRRDDGQKNAMTSNKNDVQKRTAPRRRRS